MHLYKCTNCGYETESEVAEPPEKCPFCKLTLEDAQDLWDEMD